MAAVNDDQKVMDVSKPGKGKVVATSRPVVAPIVDTAKPKVEVEQTDDDHKSGTGSSRKIIQPISDSGEIDTTAEVPVAVATDTPPDPVPGAETNTKAPDEDSLETPAADASNVSDAASVDTLAASAETKKQAAKKAEEQAKRDAELQELIDSKKYLVPIKHGVGGNGGTRLLLVGMLIVVLLLVGVYLLIDAGIVDVGVELPFEFIKETK